MSTVRISLVAVLVLGLSACGSATADPNDTRDSTTMPTDTTTTVPEVTREDLVVPDLTGLTLAEARLVAAEVGLDLMALPRPIEDAIVMAQDPAAGAETITDTVVTVDVQTIPTCNPPDPLAPDPGQSIITVLFECANDTAAPSPGIGVPRVVPEPNTVIDRIERTLRSLLAGPTADERAVGFDSFFDAATADALNSVTLTGGRLVVDFNGAIVVNNMTTTTGRVFFNAELSRNLFLHPEVDSVEFHLDGSCAAWSALFEASGCQDVSRADWERDLAAWDQERDQ